MTAENKKTLIIELTVGPNLASTNHYAMPDEKSADHLDLYSTGFVAGYSERLAESAGWRGFFVGLALGATLIGYIVTTSAAHAVRPGPRDLPRLRRARPPGRHRRAGDRHPRPLRGGGRRRPRGQGVARRADPWPPGRDYPHGRRPLRPHAGGTDVDVAMLASGAAIPYAPGRAAWTDRCRHWCPSAPRCEE